MGKAGKIKKAINNFHPFAYNNCVQNIILTDADTHSACVFYIYNALLSYLPKESPAPRLLQSGNRYALALDGGLQSESVKKIVTDLAAETLGVGYKYAYLSQRLPLVNLSKEERKTFLCALISADLPADKGAINERIAKVDFPLALDGIYAFRMQGLREKWQGIISYIPPDFSVQESDSFFKYFVKGNRGKAYLYEGEVYDEKYRICRRSALVGGGKEQKAQTEIILSGAKEVHIASTKNKAKVSLNPIAEAFLRRYYGSNVYFH